MTTLAGILLIAICLVTVSYVWYRAGYKDGYAKGRYLRRLKR